MYIEPNTNIRILNNVPLDTTYDHTLYFASAAAQSSYFITKQKYNLTGYTYQRVKRGVARVGIKADNLYDCNYMMFQNTNFGNKWFYAFITSVEYVNNETSDVFFEIDVMQTWFFDCELEHCFVEREHSVTDNIGDNIVPESLATGEYVFNDYAPLRSAVYNIVLIAIVDLKAAVAGKEYDGIYGGATLYVYESTDTSGINQLISQYLEKPDAILSMYLAPRDLLSNGTIPAGHLMPSGQVAAVNPVTAAAITKLATLDGYTPKNAKLYTYPYNYYHVDNSSGGELSLRYEFFSNLTPTMEISGTFTQPVSMMLRPTNYKNVSNDATTGANTLNTETVSLNNFPMCSWNMDAYKAWVAQNSVPLAINTVGSLANTAISAASGGGAASAASGIIGTATNLLSQVYRASIAADICRGNLSNGGVNIARRKQNFFGGRVSVSHEFARMIDDYFTMYGYAVNRCKVPNTHSRPHWNYVKTVGCTMTGSVPADDMRRICSIYDNGITFWKSGSEVGRYDLDNRPS